MERVKIKLGDKVVGFDTTRKQAVIHSQEFVNEVRKRQCNICGFLKPDCACDLFKEYQGV